MTTGVTQEPRGCVDEFQSLMISPPELQNAIVEGLEKCEPDGRVNVGIEIEVAENAERKSSHEACLLASAAPISAAGTPESDRRRVYSDQSCQRHHEHPGSRSAAVGGTVYSPYGADLSGIDALILLVSSASHPGAGFRNGRGTCGHRDDPEASRRRYDDPVIAGS